MLNKAEKARKIMFGSINTELSSMDPIVVNFKGHNDFFISKFRGGDPERTSWMVDLGVTPSWGSNGNVLFVSYNFNFVSSNTHVQHWWFWLLSHLHEWGSLGLWWVLPQHRILRTRKTRGSRKLWWDGKFNSPYRPCNPRRADGKIKEHQFQWW